MEIWVTHHIVKLMKSAAAGKSFFPLNNCINSCLLLFMQEKYVYQISIVALAKMFIGETHVLMYQNVQMCTVEKVLMGEQNYGNIKWSGRRKNDKYIIDNAGIYFRTGWVIFFMTLLVVKQKCSMLYLQSLQGGLIFWPFIRLSIHPWY